jgi:MscS family membrane protein
MQNNIFKKIFNTVLLSAFFIFIGNAQAPPTGLLNNPYQAVYQHLYYLQPDTYQPDKAAEALIAAGDSMERVERAIQLKQILDGMGLFVRMERIPLESNWQDSTSGRDQYVLFPYELPDVFVTLNDGKWEYSLTTWEAIPRLHREVYPFGADRLINAFGKYGGQKFLGLYVWQWLSSGGLILALFLFYWLLFWALLPLIKRIFKRIDLYQPGQSSPLKSMDRYLTLWLVAQLAIMLIPVLFLPPTLNEWLIHGLRIASWILLLFTFLRLLDLIFLFLRGRAALTETTTDEQILPILRKMAQIVVVIMVLIPILRLMEVNLTALIAGLSIGGLALALAAQDTVKNLISTALIFVDHPYQLGDYIIAAGVEGTVVEIGFRSTRIMMIDSSIITIPNNNIINNEITNLGVREFRLIQFMVGVIYSTPPEKIMAFIEGLRKMSSAHPLTQDDRTFVYLNELNSSSIDIRFRAAISADDLRTEYIIREELVLGIIELAHALDISFAFPSQSVYLETTPEKGEAVRPLPADWQERSEKEVQRMLKIWSEKEPPQVD